MPEPSSFKVIHHGDLFDVLPTLPADSIEACVTDPPFEMAFMGRHWDRSGVAFQVETWQQVYRVLKPGAHMLVAGIGRTHHRMMVAVEDAGFEVRDCIYHLFGSGFPKSLDVSKAIDDALGTERAVIGTARGKGGQNLNLLSRPTGDDSDSAKGCGAYGHGAKQVDIDIPITAPATDAAKQWDGWGTALKPAAEIWTLFRKPLIGSVAQNILTHGTGALNIDATRIGYQDESDKASATPQGRCTNKVGALAGKTQHDGQRTEFDRPEQLGRWPSNVVLGCCGQDPHDPGCAVALLDAQSGQTRSAPQGAGGEWTQPDTGFTRGGSARGVSANYADFGGASRFFFQAKPSREERDYGCWDLRPMSGAERTGRKEGSAGLVGNPENKGQTGNPYSGGNGSPLRNSHPTVKPVELMRYLVRLICPPGGTVLDCFMGSGSTGMACRYELRQFIGVEREAEYFRIAERRIANCVPLFGDEASA